jgi:hypothetical protein
MLRPGEMGLGERFIDRRYFLVEGLIAQQRSMRLMLCFMLTRPGRPRPKSLKVSVAPDATASVAVHKLVNRF